MIIIMMIIMIIPIILTQTIIMCVLNTMTCLNARASTIVEV